MPRVSVVIPAYNRERYLPQTIQSILDQTFTDFEIIVVDDGSTDGSHEAITAFGDRVQYVHQENQGAPAARNNGVNRAKGEYIAFLDSDDLFFPDKLQSQVDVLDQKPEVGLVYGWSQVIDENDAISRDSIKPTEEGRVLKTLLRYNYVTTTSLIMVRREVFDRVGYFDTSLRISDDYDMWLRIANAGYEFACLQKYLVKYRVHSSGITRQVERMIQEHAYVLNKFFSAPDLPEDILALKSGILGYEHLIDALRYYGLVLDNDKGHNALKEAAHYDPTLFIDTERLAQTIADFALFNSTTDQDALAFVNRALPGLAEVTPGLALQDLTDKVVGCLHASLAFRYYEHQEYPKVREHVYKALVHDRNWLSNRGFMSIGAKSVLGQRISKLVRSSS